MTLKQIRKTVSIIVLVLAAGAIGWWLGQRQLTKNLGLGPKNFKLVNTNTPSDQELDFSLFWQVWQKLEEKYLEKAKIDKEKMFYGAIEGMTASLGDPYTAFFPPSANKQVKEDLNGAFEGVGIRLGFNKDKRLVVMSPLKGMPAEAAGVRAGDLILHLKDEVKGLDEDTASLTLPEAVEKIRGPENTKITLILQHEGESEPYTVEIVRKTIIVASVEVEFIDGKIAHLKLTKFGDRTDQEWNESILKIKNQNAKIEGVILDVRGNPGGYLKGAVNLASEFLNKGIIVKQEDYQGEVETYSVNRRGRLLDIPLVVLVDKGSASASEILAAALQEADRAQLVGETTFGKGTIQEAEDMARGSALHITTAKWLTPKGVWLNETGLKPDFEVKNDPAKPEEDKQLEKAIDILTQNGLK